MSVDIRWCTDAAVVCDPSEMQAAAVDDALKSRTKEGEIATAASAAGFSLVGRQEGVGRSAGQA